MSFVHHNRNGNIFIVQCTSLPCGVSHEAPTEDTGGLLVVYSVRKIPTNQLFRYLFHELRNSDSCAWIVIPRSPTAGFWRRLILEAAIQVSKWIFRPFIRTAILRIIWRISYRHSIVSHLKLDVCLDSPEIRSHSFIHLAARNLRRMGTSAYNIFYLLTDFCDVVQIPFQRRGTWSEC